MLRCFLTQTGITGIFSFLNLFPFIVWSLKMMLKTSNTMYQYYYRSFLCRQRVIGQVLPRLHYQAMLLSSTTNNIFKEYDSITKRGQDREKVTYQVGDVVHDFQCTMVRPVPELSLTAYEFRHLQTKADYIHLDTSDTDNTFRSN